MEELKVLIRVQLAVLPQLLLAVVVQAVPRQSARSFGFRRRGLVLVKGLHSPAVGLPGRPEGIGHHFQLVLVRFVLVL